MLGYNLKDAKTMVASLWIAVGGLDSKFNVADLRQAAKAIGFACPELNYSLRNTNEIVRHSKDSPVKMDLGASVTLNIDVRYSQVFEGMPVDLGSKVYDDPITAFKSAFSQIPATTKVVIIIYLFEEAYYDSEYDHERWAPKGQT